MYISSLSITKPPQPHLIHDLCILSSTLCWTTSKVDPSFTFLSLFIYSSGVGYYMKNVRNYLYVYVLQSWPHLTSTFPCVLSSCIIIYSWKLVWFLHGRFLEEWWNILVTYQMPRDEIQSNVLRIREPLFALFDILQLVTALFCLVPTSYHNLCFETFDAARAHRWAICMPMIWHLYFF